MFTTVVSNWNFSHGKFGLLSPRKASYDTVLLGKPRCSLALVRFHNLSISDMDYRIIDVHIDVNACDGTQWCADTIRQFAPKLTQGEKSLAAPGNRTCVRGVPVRRFINWATSPPQYFATTVCLHSADAPLTAHLATSAWLASAAALLGVHAYLPVGDSCSCYGLHLACSA